MFSKMYIVRLFYVCYLLISIPSLYAIDSERPLSIGAERKLADYLYNSASYYTAYDYYKDVVRRKPFDRYAIYGCALSLMKGRDYENAALWMEKFNNLTPPIKPSKLKQWNKETEILFYRSSYEYAMMLKMSGQYDKARSQFDSVIKSYNFPDKEYIIKRSLLEKEGIDLAQSKSATIKYKIEKLNDQINKGYSELSPYALNDSQMLFATIRTDKTVYYDKATKEKLPTFQIYRAVYEGNEWTGLRPFVDEVNDKDMHTANGSFSQDGNRFYFTKCIDQLDNSEVKCQLYMAEKKVNVWQKAIKLDEQINNVNYTCTHPAVRSAPNGRDIVYFVSDKPGGKGGLDIWYFVRLKEGNFRASQPLKWINTPYDEATPFFSNEDSTLYFSSNGYPSFGGFDIFKSTENETADWSPVTNLGAPFNTSADDQFFNKTPNINTGFITSNRVGSTPLQSKTCCDDIYKWKPYMLVLNGAIFQKDKGDKSPMTGAIKKAYRIEPNGTKTLIATDTSSSPQFNFNLPGGYDYDIVAEKDGFAPIKEVVKASNIAEDDTTYKEFGLDKTGIMTKGKVYDEEDKTKSSLYGVIVQIMEINQKTGNEKLISKLVTSSENDQLVFPIEKSRRYKVTYKKADYFAKTIYIEPNQDKTSEDISQALTPMEIGKAYSLSNIYYEYKKADLTSSSMKTLDTLVTLLNDNANIIIELGSHTDSIASDVYNQKLSQSRAESCVKYIISKGVKPERLKAKGYGESLFIAPNSTPEGKDNPEGRQKNRRTEFKIVGKIGGTMMMKDANDRKGKDDIMEMVK